MFKSTSVKKAGPDRYSIEGELSMHGVTKTITAEAVFTGAGETPVAEANQSVSRPNSWSSVANLA